ncbi:WD40 repeat domain-containing protein [Nostoc sp. 'Peltigera malacea cyanobiont' DB3992]|uniref:WD40 repeat domain-containing protein n=1 Tax=Nostoc sp. 'Peltigera malacea cyanobiont' DB3992 TaxID=1206980 RepID=UPI00211E2159|nr:WD40 repeat domain-containing protein [Nostoc sp. 'Peltigera malacea cyanobiont' DB3992]
MRSKQITWKSSAALAISTLTILVGSSSCTSLLSSLRRKSVATISVATTQPLRSLQGNSTWVYALAISPDGRFLANGSYDKKLKFGICLVTPYSIL